MTAQDPLGKITSFIYDANGNKIQENDPRGYSKKYEYDALNRLTKVTDEDNNVTVYDMDDLGNITTVTDPKGNKTSIVYNYAVLKPATITNEIGQTVTNQYDNEGNTIKTTYWGGCTCWCCRISLWW